MTGFTIEDRDWSTGGGGNTTNTGGGNYQRGTIGGSGSITDRANSRGGNPTEEIKNILGHVITSRLYKYNEYYNRPRGTTERRFEWLPKVEDEKALYMKIYGAKNTDQKVAAINARITQILEHANGLGLQLQQIGINVQNKDFWERATPFLTTLFFAGLGAKLGVNGSGSIGNMVTGYVNQNTTQFLAVTETYIKSDLTTLNNEAQSLNAELQRIDAEYINKDKLLAELQSEITRSANTSNNIGWIIVIALILLFIIKMLNT